MRSLRSLLAAITAALAVFCAAPADAATLYVNAACGNDTWAGTNPGCITFVGPKRTISAAIAAAQNGDVIQVAPGTYRERINFAGKNITISAADPDPALTVIDAGGLSGAVVSFISGEGVGASLQGLTITGGVNTNGSGGGIRINNASPRIIGCVIAGNAAGFGAGALVQSGSPHFINCVFRQNSASSLGGGLNVGTAAMNVLVAGCTFDRNSTGQSGGGVAIEGGEAVVADCLFIGNSATFGGGGLFAGGGAGGDPASAVVRRSEFRANTVTNGTGGAVNCFALGITVENCLMVGNSAPSAGGGFSNQNSTGTRIINCTIVGNSVGGAFNASGVFHSNGSIDVVNSIVWGNAGGSAAITQNAAVTVSFSVVEGGFTGAGNLSADPAFVAPAAGNFRLAPNSPAIDAGNNAAVLPGTITDLANAPRFVDVPATPNTGAGTAPIVDIGAYEAPTVPVVQCPGNFNADGAVDTADIVEFLNAWFRARAGNC